MAPIIGSDFEQHMITPFWRPKSQPKNLSKDKNLKSAAVMQKQLPASCARDTKIKLEMEESLSSFVLCPRIFLPDTSSPPNSSRGFKLKPRTSARTHRDLLEFCKPLSKKPRRDTQFVPLDLGSPEPQDRQPRAAEGNENLASINERSGSPFEPLLSLSQHDIRFPSSERVREPRASRPRAVRQSRSALHDSADSVTTTLVLSGSSAFSSNQ